MSTGWQSIDDFLTSLGVSFGAPTSEQTTGGAHVPSSEHYQGRARDYGDASSDVNAIANALLPYATGADAPVDELFFSPLGIFMKNGQPITPDAALRAEHYNHVHVGIRPGIDLTQAVGGVAEGRLVSTASGEASSSSGGFFGKLLGLGLVGVGLVTGVALIVAGAGRKKAPAVTP